MDDEMKAARAAWWSVVNWDHLDELTACEAWDAAERVHRAIVADIPGEAERDALHMRLAAAEDANAACNADCARVRAERDALRALLKDVREGVDMIGCSSEGYDSLRTYRDELLARIDTAIDAAIADSCGVPVCSEACDREARREHDGCVVDHGLLAHQIPGRLDVDR